jgi:hypothetical protein
VRNRIRTRAAVAKEEAAVVTPRVAGGRGKGAAKQTRNTKAAVAAHPKAAAPGAPKAKVTGRGKQVSSRSQSAEPEPVQDYCAPEDNAAADLDLEDEKQEEGAEIREMEEESAGRTAEKVAGAEEEGSAAPLPERVIDSGRLLAPLYSRLVCPVLRSPHVHIGVE